MLPKRTATYQEPRGDDGPHAEGCGMGCIVYGAVWLYDHTALYGAVWLYGAGREA